MKQHEIRVGGVYVAKVSNKLTKVRVDSIDSMTLRGRTRSMYHVTNLATGRKTTFGSAQKFRSEVEPVAAKLDVHPVAGPNSKTVVDIEEVACDCSPRSADPGEKCEECGGVVEGEQGSDPTTTSRPPTGGRSAGFASGSAKTAPASASAPSAAVATAAEGKQSADPTRGAGATSAGSSSAERSASSKSASSASEHVVGIGGHFCFTCNADACTCQCCGKCVCGTQVERVAGYGNVCRPCLEANPMIAGGSPVPASSRVSEKLKALVARSSAASPPLADAAPHVEVQALAGTGKTTTLIAGLADLRGRPLSITPSEQQRAVWDALKLGRSDSVRISAFSTKITDALKERCQQTGLDRLGVEARGIHSLGLQAVTKAFGRQEANNWATLDRVCDHNKVEARNVRKDDPRLWNAINAAAELVSLCKQTMTHADEEGLDALTSHYGIDLNGSRELVYGMVGPVLEASKAPNGRIAFDDMIWLPLMHDLPIFRVDVQVIDESQDLNRMQQQLMLKAGHRIVYVGDVNQSIMGFAGADVMSMQRLREDLSATPAGLRLLPLTVTRRCGKAIVREAARYVPEFAAHESNPEGLIGEAEIDRNHPDCYQAKARDGDFVLCRTNAPLVSHCFRFLKEGRRANILGRKIGEGLISLIDKSKQSEVPGLIGWLGDWLAREQANEQAKRFPSEDRMAGLADKHDCLVAFSEGLRTADEVKAKVNAIFSDAKSKGITLSSIHKSKGLEAERVFWLQPKGGPRRDKMQDWELQQEDNLRYVAITRAIRELWHVVER
jgi:superfamily I DNA/RNA helicase